jgi:hypothetical protein
MADFTADRIGQIEGAGDDRALFLKLFSGEVITRIPEQMETKGLTWDKVLRSGKSYQFPYTGTLVPQYHVPGTELVGQTTKNNERVIGLDDLMVVDRFTPKVDTWMKHFDDRAPYAAQMAESLGLAQDINVFLEAIKGARASSIVSTNDADGLVITSDKFQNDGVGTVGSLDDAELLTNIYQACAQAAKHYKQKRVPKGVKKCLFITWDLYFRILGVVQTNGFSLFNKDYHSGSAESGMIPPLFGITIEGSNNIPQTDLSAIANAQATDGVHFYHKADCSKTVGISIGDKAVATVKASDITIEVDPYSARYKGQLITADYLAGHGYIRPELLVELSLDTLDNA